MPIIHLYTDSMVQALDYEIVNWAVHITQQSSWITSVVYVCADLLVYIFPAVLLALWARPEVASHRHGAQKAVVLAIFSVVLALAIKSGLEFIFIRPRPFITYPDLAVLHLRVDSSNSFPSGHTMFAFAIAASLRLSGFKKLGNWLLVLAVLVGLGRVFSGVHYPSDVLVGAVLSLGVAWFLHRDGSTLRRYLPNN